MSEYKLSQKHYHVTLPPIEQVFDWAFNAMRERNWQEAANRWAILRRAYPERPATWFQAAIALMEAGELNQAAELLEYCRQQFPDHPNSLLESASLAMHEKDWKKAAHYLQQAREKHSDHIQTWLKSSQLAEQQGDISQAEKYLLTAQQVQPDRPIAFLQHAELAMQQEQWEQALQRWETLRKLFPDLPAGYHRAAEAERQLDRPKQARKLCLAQQYGIEILEANEQNENTENTALKITKRKRPGQFLSLIWTKARFNLRSEVHRNYLSYGWWVLEPLIHMTVYYLVFGLLLNHGGKNYPVFLLTGLIPWMWFSKTISGSSNSILAGQNLMLQVNLPTLFFPLVSLLQATFKQIPVFLLLFGFLWLLGFTPNHNWWALLPLMLVQSILIIAVGTAVAAIIPFARDLSYLVPTGLMFLMFISGIFYDYKSIAAQWQDIFLLNPLAFLLKSYREILMQGNLPDLHTLGLWGAAELLACLLMFSIYNRLRYLYPKIVLE